MTETLANLLDITKEVWTQDRLERQFYNKNLWLDKVEKTNKYSIGRKAHVPVEKSLPGGYSAMPSTGGTLNSSDALHVDVAIYDLKYHYQQVEIQIAAMAQVSGPGVRATIDAQDQLVESNMDALRREIGRQSVGNGDALIAITASGAANTTILLEPTGYGYDAIVRGWLRPGQVIDVGTTANEVSVGDAVTISSVTESASAPSLVVNTSVTETASTYVSIANARAGTTSYEMDGLRTIVGSTTSAVGTLDPDNAGEEFWKPASVDTSTTLVSLDLLLDLQRGVFQKTGAFPTFVTTSPKQQANLYAQFQNQVRFDPDKTTAGNAHAFTWNGLSIQVDPDIPDRELYMLNLSDFFVVTDGQFGKPTWMSDIEGAGGRFRWVQGNTKFVDAIVYPIQLAIKRRNSHSAAIGLTA